MESEKQRSRYGKQCCDMTMSLVAEVALEAVVEEQR